MFSIFLLSIFEGFLKIYKFGGDYISFLSNFIYVKIYGDLVGDCGDLIGESGILIPGDFRGLGDKQISPSFNFLSVCIFNYSFL